MTLAPLTAAGSRPALTRSNAGKAGASALGRLRRAYAGVPASGGGSPRWRHDALRARVTYTVPSGLAPPAGRQKRERHEREE